MKPFLHTVWGTEYEYYYVYYDEEGNMVNKSPPKEIPEATLNKIQDIPLASSTNKIPTTIDNHIQVCTSWNWTFYHQKSGKD